MTTYTFRNNEIILIGDTHSMSVLQALVLSKDIPQGSDLFCVGDCGIGFGPKRRAIKQSNDFMTRMDQLCTEADVRIFINRGNHDAPYPEIWDKKYESVIMLHSGDLGIFPNGKKALMVGGAISIDRTTRKEGVSYWEDEGTPDIFASVPECDVMFSHDCPPDFNHNTRGLDKRYPGIFKDDPNLAYDCDYQRAVVHRIVVASKVKRIYYGHYHRSLETTIDGVYGRCIDINELFYLDTTLF